MTQGARRGAEPVLGLLRPGRRRRRRRAPRRRRSLPGPHQPADRAARRPVGDRQDHARRSWPRAIPAATSRGSTRTARSLTAPFTVTPDNPVTGYLPLGQTCCWAELEGRAAGGFRPPLSDVPTRMASRVATEAGAGDVGRVVLRRVERPGASILWPASVAPFSLEGVVATPLGDAPVAVRSSAPYHVYASHIERVVVRGSGTVTGFSWLPASAVDVFERFRTAPLPTGSGARYAGPADGKDEGFKRVERGAPQRFGMHESPLAAAPVGCDPVGASDELDRVSALTGEPSNSLDRLINDTSLPQRLLTTAADGLRRQRQLARHVEPLRADGRPARGRRPGHRALARVPRRRRDGAAEERRGRLRRRRAVRTGLEGHRPSAGCEQTLPSGTVVEDGAKAVHDMAAARPGAYEVRRPGGADGRRALPGSCGSSSPPPRACRWTCPPRPRSTRPVTGDWLPAPAPTARREVTVALERLTPAAGIASAIAQPAGGHADRAQPGAASKRRLLLTARPDDAASTATSGVLADRLADEQDGTWQVAQADWFGRWSGWARQAIAPASAAPPTAASRSPLTTRPPVVPTPTPTGTLAGRRPDRGLGAAGRGPPVGRPAPGRARADDGDQRRRVGA